MIVLAYSKVCREQLTASIGLPQYSYYFVLEKFRPILETLGEVIELWTNEQIDYHIRLFAERGEPCVLFSFTPPQDIPEQVGCPVICVVAWEFTNIPDETWDDNPNNDWHVALRKVQAVITLSQHTKRVIQQAMGEDFPVTAIPVPIWDRYQGLRASLPRSIRKNADIKLGNVSLLDSHDIRFGMDELTLSAPARMFPLTAWDRSVIQLDFFGNSLDSGRLCGFYDPEPWGVWSRLPSPWLLLPVRLEGSFVLEFEAAGYGVNVGHTVDVMAGNQHSSVVLEANFSVMRATFTVSKPVQVIVFGGLLKCLVGTAEDHRTLGMGIRWLRILPAEDTKQGIDDRRASPPQTRTIAPTVPDITPESRTLQLSGIVYTMLLNPVDQRKNWSDILSAFCHAFRDCPDAVLVMKMSHRHPGSFLGKLTYHLEQMQPFKCRIIALHGFMDDNALASLIEASTYYLNASLCEGLCMPLMEFMSAGVPGIAARNTAMEDYVNEDTHFIVESSLAPTIWPQDPRHLIKTLQYRVSWESLEQQLRHSYQTATQDSARYRSLSRRSLTVMSEYCADTLIQKKIGHVASLVTRP